MITQEMKTINPLDYVKIAFRRKWFIITPVILGIIGGMIFGNTLPKIYEASTLVLVEEGKTANPLMQGLTVSTSTAQRLSVLREQLLGWDRVFELIKALNLAKDIRNQFQFEDLVKRLRNNIRVTMRNNSVISISYRGSVPKEAQDIVKTITDIFISENLRQQNKESEDAISFINNQLLLYQKKLKQAQISAMQDQLRNLLIDSTEKHPLVIELEKKIATAQDQLQRGDYTLDKSVSETIEEAAKTPKVIITRNTRFYNDGANRTILASETSEKLDKLLSKEDKEPVPSQDQNVNQKLYNSLLERLETAKITQRLEASKEGTRYTILDPARLPLKPIKPNKPMLLLLGAFMGFSSGIGLVLLLELFDHSFLGVDEAKVFLELPVFGAVSKIITHGDLKTQKVRNVRIVSISVATGVVLLIFIVFNVFIGH